MAAVPASPAGSAALHPIADFNPLLQMPSGVYLTFFGSFVFGTPGFPLSDVPLQEIAADVAAGRLDAKPSRVFGFDEIREAHRVMEANEAARKDGRRPRLMLRADGGVVRCAGSAATVHSGVVPTAVPSNVSARPRASGGGATPCWAAVFDRGRLCEHAEKWRTRQDSNLWPLPSEGSALSS